MKKEKNINRKLNARNDSTELDVEHVVFEKNIFHRDYFAHFLRWSHILKVMSQMKGKASLADIGCGEGVLAKLLYTNRCAPSHYLGIDVDKKKIDRNVQNFEKLDWAEFVAADVTDANFKHPQETFDIVTSFDVLEHVGKDNVPAFLESLSKFGKKDATFYLSTPNYDKRVGAAQNHIYGGKINEWEHEELYAELCKVFTVEKRYGTFASQRDYVDLMNPEMLQIWTALRDYYDSNTLSVMFAPLFPTRARNCMWILRQGRSSYPGKLESFLKGNELSKQPVASQSRLIY
jgi:2-polyprenyl-3-methyl-5-hydroxy-6-metoxy-1,4-benzoquinol methylase